MLCDYFEVQCFAKQFEVIGCHSVHCVGLVKHLSLGVLIGFLTKILMDSGDLILFLYSVSCVCRNPYHSCWSNVINPAVFIPF